MSRALYSLHEWNRLADDGLVEEPKYSPDRPTSGVGCPNLLGKYGEVCGSHLFDILSDTNTPKGFQSVFCYTCGAEFYRRIARKNPNGLNGGGK